MWQVSSRLRLLWYKEPRVRIMGRGSQHEHVFNHILVVAIRPPFIPIRWSALLQSAQVLEGCRKLPLTLPDFGPHISMCVWHTLGRYGQLAAGAWLAVGNPTLLAGNKPSHEDRLVRGVNEKGDYGAVMW